ncbi:MAG: hypothetical protein IH971_09715 [Candidatus Marinimicrobia bacterium]|nr:hypothetical protein [Candidatus Neomarinimicrobiota bacterium]
MAGARRRFHTSKAFVNDHATFGQPHILTTQPLGLTDQVMGIVGYDWESGQAFGFAQWQRTFDAVSLHVILTGSPAGGSDLAAGQSQSGAALTSFGVAIQFMMIYNY